MGFMLIGMPKSADDYWYMMNLKGWFDSQGIVDPNEGGNVFKFGIPWDGLVETWKDHYYNDNIRLANILGLVFLLFPKWLGSSLALLSFMYAVLQGFKLIGLNWRTTLLLPSGLLMLVLCLPWYDHMGSVIYQFNYVIPTGITIWYIMRLKNKCGTLYVDIATFGAGLAISMWHEGFGFPLLCGSCVLLFYANYRNRNTVMGMTGLFIGLIWSFLSPGMVGRASRNVGIEIDDLLNKHYLIDLAQLEWNFVIMLLLAALMFFTRYNRRIFGNGVSVFIIVCATISLMMMIGLNGANRAGWLCSFLSVYGIMDILGRFQPKPAVRMAAIVLNVIVLAVISVSLFGISRESVRLNSMMHKMLTELSSNPDEPVVFVDYRNLGKLPVMNFKLPCYKYNTLGIGFVRWYIKGDSGVRRVALVPTVLKNITAESGNKLDGSGDFRQIDGYCFKPYDQDDHYGAGLAKVRMDYGKGYVDADVYVTVFRSKADGKKYLFLDPPYFWYLSHFKKIYGIANPVIVEKQ